MYKIDISDEARSDLFDLLTYIQEKEGIRIAQRVLDTLLMDLYSLQEDPFRWPIYNTLPNGIELRRRASGKSYSIIYVLLNETIVVQRVWHNARNPDNLLTL
jgi:plasmid stabilization system protein ParE